MPKSFLAMLFALCSWGGAFATPCAVPIYADVQPIFQQYCTLCHSTSNTYSGVQGMGFAEIARRTGLPLTAADHMPLATQAQPSAADVAEIQAWVTAGANDLCPEGPPPPPPPTITLQIINSAILSDLGKLGVSDRPFARYLLTAGALNDGVSTTLLVNGMNKGLNSLSTQSEELTSATNVTTGVFRIDIRSYGITAADIAAIESADILNIVDNTTSGKIIQSLVNDAHPWFMLDDFLDVTFRNSTVYYILTNVPTTLSAYQAQIGVSFQQDLATLPSVPGGSGPQVSFIGAVGQISEQKNRLLVRDIESSRTTKAYYWQTFDVNAQPSGPADTKDLFNFPLLAGTGAQLTGASVANYTQDASEVIAQLPNGMQAYSLWDGLGNRLNAADPAVVIDNQTPLGNHQISVGMTCSRCHNLGMIPLVDKVLASATQSADQFTSNDFALIQAVYHDAGTNAGLFAEDSATFQTALATLGIQPGADPLNQIDDRFLLNWSLTQLAGELLITPAQLTTCINGSGRTKASIGELVTGGTAPAADIFAALPGLITDCRLFQDSIAN